MAILSHYARDQTPNQFFVQIITKITLYITFISISRRLQKQQPRPLVRFTSTVTKLVSN